MKHNPRLNEKMARLPGFSDIHPLQPQSTVQGALELMDQLAHWLTTLTGMPAVALSPKAGAHGELCGLMAIRAAHEAKGEHEQRRKVLVPTSAHGTNPATAAFVGYSVVEVAQTDDGRVDVADLASKLGPDVAAIMTFSTPHGGGGPGAGPVVLSEALAPFAPAPWVVNTGDGYKLVEREEDEAEQAFGRLCAFQGQMG
ncbi:hypothetical protein LTR94_029681, partial [Friedmanniomyces endolithicus]